MKTTWSKLLHSLNYVGSVDIMIQDVVGAVITVPLD